MTRDTDNDFARQGTRNFKGWGGLTGKIARGFAVAMALMLGTSFAHAASSADLTSLRDQVFTPTVFLNMGAGTCSGEIIYSNRDQKSGEVKTLVLTAKHCIPSSEAMEIRVIVPTYDKKGAQTSDSVFYATTFAKSWEVDSALLVLRDKSTYFDHVAKVAPLDVALIEGEDVWAVGYPLGFSRTITQGLLAANIRVDQAFFNDGAAKLHEYTHATPDIAGGSSGGGLWHKNAKGEFELIGTATALPGANHFMGIFTSVGDIQDFLKASAPDVYEAQFGKKPEITPYVPWR